MAANQPPTYAEYMQQMETPIWSGRINLNLTRCDLGLWTLPNGLTCNLRINPPTLRMITSRGDDSWKYN
jgi:hypothetical protein